MNYPGTCPTGCKSTDTPATCLATAKAGGGTWLSEYTSARSAYDIGRINGKCVVHYNNGGNWYYTWFSVHPITGHCYATPVVQALTYTTSWSKQSSATSDQCSALKSKIAAGVVKTPKVLNALTGAWVQNVNCCPSGFICK